MKRKLLFIFLSVLLTPAAFTQTNLVTNPGFEDPDDGTKYKLLNNNQITAWTTEDTVTDHEGREPATNMEGKYRAYMNGLAKELYQDIGVVIPAAGALYTYSIKEKMNWEGSGTSTDTIYHILSFDAYPKGGDATQRVKIDTFPIVLPNPGGVYGVDTVLIAKLNIPANSKWAGQNLCIGYYMRNYNAKNNGSDWDNIDSVTLIQSAPVVNIASITNLSTNIFPNPSTGIINLKACENANIKVYNTLGELVKTLKLEKSSASIDLSNLAKGMYFVNVSSDNDTGTQKLILK